MGKSKPQPKPGEVDDPTTDPTLTPGTGGNDDNDQGDDAGAQGNPPGGEQHP